MSHTFRNGGIQSTQQHCSLAHCKRSCKFVDQLRKLMSLRGYTESTADRIVRFHQKHGTSEQLAKRIKVD